MIPYKPITQINILGFQIQPEPIAMTIAFIVFILYVYFHLKKAKFDKNIVKPKEFLKFIVVVIIFSLIGGRIWAHASNWRGLINFLDIRKPGVISMGMLIGGAIGVLIYVLFIMKKKKNKQLQFARLADILAPATALWIFIYRTFGCCIYGICTKGTETNVPWGLYWVEEGVVRHPVTFYMAFSALVIFLILRLFFGYEKK